MVWLFVHLRVHYYRRERSLNYPDMIRWEFTHRSDRNFIHLPPWTCDDEIVHVKTINVLLEQDLHGAWHAHRIKVYRPRDNPHLVYRTTLWEFVDRRDGPRIPRNVRYDARFVARDTLRIEYINQNQEQ